MIEALNVGTLLSTQVQSSFRVWFDDYQALAKRNERNTNGTALSCFQFAPARSTPEIPAPQQLAKVAPPLPWRGRVPHPLDVAKAKAHAVAREDFRAAGRRKLPSRSLCL
jgi:hypothetical protein